MDRREKYAKLYYRLISPQSEQSIVNYFSYELDRLLEEEYESNQSIDFWKGFKKFIQIQEKRLYLEKDRNIIHNTLEEYLFDSQKPHKVLDILSWLDVKLMTEKDTPLLNNQYHKIFSNDLGYTLFNEWNEQHKDETNLLANYSFIYIALEKDNLVVCTQTDYVDFLSQLDKPIIIDKVDSRQQGKSNKKYKLYESNKKRYRV